MENHLNQPFFRTGAGVGDDATLSFAFGPPARSPDYATPVSCLPDEPPPAAGAICPCVGPALRARLSPLPSTANGPPAAWPTSLRTPGLTNPRRRAGSASQDRDRIALMSHDLGRDRLARVGWPTNQQGMQRTAQAIHVATRIDRPGINGLFRRHVVVGPQDLPLLGSAHRRPGAISLSASMRAIPNPATLTAATIPSGCRA